MRDTTLKHIFIINPAAGRGDAGKIYLPIIEKITKVGEIEHEIHISKPDGEATSFVRNRCVERKDNEVLRFYACGGDGTVNEVVNGLQGFIGVQAAMIPNGTGNDFIRNFSGPEFFLNMARQIKGQTMPTDVIAYKAEGENQRDGVIVNMGNIGVDSEAAYRMSFLKKKLLITGTSAYVIALMSLMAGKMGIDMELTFDDNTVEAGNFLLVTFANGCYCGGGFKAAPDAKMNDGLIDVCMVKRISKTKMAYFSSKYKNGMHLEDEKMKEYVTYKRCKSVKISTEEPQKLCIDGEHISACNYELTVNRGTLLFSVPLGSSSHVYV